MRGPDADAAGMVDDTPPANRAGTGLWGPCRLVAVGLGVVAADAPIVAGAALIAVGLYVGARPWISSGAASSPP